MKNFYKLLLCLFSLSLTTICLAGRPIVTTGGNPSLAPMLQKAMPAVVNIAVRGEMPPINVPVLDKQQQQHNIKVNPKFEDLGSGVIVDAAHGFIITNAHVVKDAQVITVTLHDGRSIVAKIIGIDPPSDIAVIQINAKRLQSLPLGDSDKLKVGDFVCAIGSPFGLQQTVTSGVVSGLERSGLGIESVENFIQTDAPINPGNSGGALVNMKGELIGINTAIVAPAPGSAGIGLAIPSNMTRGVAEQLVQYGKVKRGIMGVMVQDVTPALAEAMNLKNAEGAIITQVLDGTPAASAGLKSKDIVVKIMDKPVRSAAQVSNTISLMRIGSDINLQVLRDNKLINIRAQAVDPEEMKKAEQSAPKMLLSGVELKSFNQLVDNQLIKGVEVLYVDFASAAYSSGLRPGDVILSAANQAVTTISELQTIAHKNSKQLLIEIKRGLSGNLFLVLES